MVSCFLCQMNMIYKFQICRNQCPKIDVPLNRFGDYAFNHNQIKAKLEINIQIQIKQTNSQGKQNCLGAIRNLLRNANTLTSSCIILRKQKPKFLPKGQPNAEFVIDTSLSLSVHTPIRYLVLNIAAFLEPKS